MRNETAAISANIHGEELYQERARRALPILVRQAFAGEPLYYKQLADELGMPNPRNLNYVLGSIGKSLMELGDSWKEQIPPIQCLVINQTDELPGEGFAWFMPSKTDWKGASKRQKKTFVQTVMQQIYAYPKWRLVLRALELDPVEQNYSEIMEKASIFRAGGESPDHLALKEFVKNNPTVVGIAKRYGPGISEKGIPSGDRIDVFFEAGQEWVGVEVKSAVSNEADIVRGLFQCVKYRAVLNAMLIAEQRDIDARSILVLENTLPANLLSLKNMLGIEVVEQVKPASRR
jgi:hypothetical protein